MTRTLTGSTSCTTTCVSPDGLLALLMLAVGGSWCWIVMGGDLKDDLWFVLAVAVGFVVALAIVVGFLLLTS